MTHPAIWPYVGDDYSGKPEDYKPNTDDRIWYVLAEEYGRIIGLFIFLPRSTVLWESHVALYPKGRIRTGPDIFAHAIRWMFENSTARRIVGEVPECNRLAVRMCGIVMDNVGYQPDSFMRDGKLQGLILFGVSKGEKRCPA